MARRAFRDLSLSTQKNYAYWESRTSLTPRLKRGLELYASCKVKTLKEAAEVVGCHPTGLIAAANSPVGQAYMGSAHEIIQDKTLDISKLLEKLARRSVEVIATTMEESDSETLRLKAAQDLADRHSSTSKTTKVTLDTTTIGTEDAKAIAAAMVEAASLRTRFAEAASGDFIRVPLDQEINPDVIPRGAPGHTDDPSRLLGQPKPPTSGES